VAEELCRVAAGEGEIGKQAAETDEQESFAEFLQKQSSKNDLQLSCWNRLGGDTVSS
jgi:hypothetical protein